MPWGGARTSYSTIPGTHPVAEDHPYPWVGAVYRTFDGSHGGTAFAVRHNYMMTAAHVVDGFTAQQLEVRLPSGQVVHAIEGGVWKHTLYGIANNYQADLAILTFPNNTFAGRYVISSDVADYALGHADRSGWLWEQVGVEYVLEGLDYD